MLMNEDRKPVKELSGEEMEIIVRNFDKVEVYHHSGNEWCILPFYGEIHTDLIYRIPRHLDHFDWTVVDPKWKHLRRDNNGEVFLYCSSPALGSMQWIIMDDWEGINITDLFSELSYKDNGMLWSEMILDRPEN